MFGFKKKNEDIIEEEKIEETEELEEKEELESDSEEEKLELEDNNESLDIDDEDVEEETADSLDDEALDEEDEKEESDSLEVSPIENKKKAKHKKARKAVKAFNMYKFVVKIIATILLLTLGVLVLVFKEQANLAIELITGGVIVFQALIRATFLLKKDRNKRAKVVSLIEILLELVIGGFFIFIAFAQYHRIVYENLTSDERRSQFLIDSAYFGDANYALFAGIAFMVGVLSYMFRVMLYNDKNDKVKFVLNVVYFIAGSVLFVFYANKNAELNASVLSIIIAVFALLSACVIGGEAGTGYYKYRKSIEDPAKKNKKKKKSKSIVDEEVDYSEIDPNSIPQDDDRNQHYVN